MVYTKKLVFKGKEGKYIYTKEPSRCLWGTPSRSIGVQILASYPICVRNGLRKNRFLCCPLDVQHFRKSRKAPETLQQRMFALSLEFGRKHPSRDVIFSGQNLPPKNVKNHHITHDILEPLKQVLSASCDVIISDQICS